MSIAKHHAEWLSLIEVSGPFLSLPVLVQRFPQGMDAHDPEHSKALRQAYEEWDEDQNGERPDRAIHRQWIDWVLRNSLDLGEVLVEGQDIPQTLKAELPEHGETLRPDKVVMEPGGSKARLLIQTYPLRQKLGRVVEGKPWAASPDTRMMQLLHDTGVRLGLVTNGDQWMLVDAPKGETTGYVSWFAPLWLEEPKTLQAFRTLLGLHRFFGVPEEETLERLLAQSAQDQQEVTDQLGYQVRRAVEVLVSSIDKANRDSGGTLLKGVPEPVLYEAALTVMMRLVFLFCAEERDLLLLGDELYDKNYAVSTLREQLRSAANDFGEDVIQRRHDAWSRLLTTFRAVYSGVRHDRLKIPAYKGNLFDPDRFPFLEGRPAKTKWKDTPGQPMPVDNRTVLHLLEALQVLQVKMPGGGPATPRKLSFRALQITQIGHVYEGLLDHTAVRATEPVLGLSGSRDSEPEVALSRLEALASKGEDDLLKFVKDETGRSSVATVKRLLASGFDDQSLGRFRTACQGDEKLWERVKPFAGLIRLDTFEYPVVIPPGSVYVTAGTDRRSSGTHYTPESLTEPIVRHTLEPLVYVGPAEGTPRDQWKLKSAAELLDLKICDMACGSGAFLVQVCIYLSLRLLEAWEEAEGRVEGTPRITPYGEVSKGLPEEQLIPLDRQERVLYARRLVAERCLYGVDKNPLAVEMAKLSLWLLTLAKDKPFTFLDHAIRCGDSLVGLSSIDQLLRFSMTENAKVRPMFEQQRQQVENRLKATMLLRKQIETQPSNTPQDIERKTLMFDNVEDQTKRLTYAADMLLTATWEARNAGELETALNETLAEVEYKFKDLPVEQLDAEAKARLRKAGIGGRFHWGLEFPEVFIDRGGFDAFVGNPPFLWGYRISTHYGSSYLDYVKLTNTASLGSSDLCVYFLRQAFRLIRREATFGLVATSSIAQADNRISSTDWLAENNCSFYFVLSDKKWIGSASIRVAVLVVYRGEYAGEKRLDDAIVPNISPFLTASKTVANPHRLPARSGIAFKGVDTGGLGFILDQPEIDRAIELQPESASVIWPYLNGKEFLTDPRQTPGRQIINFSGMTQQQAEAYPFLFGIVRDRVKPHRDTINREGLKQKWWLYNWPRPVLYQKILSQPRCLVNCVVAKHICFTFMQTNIIFANTLNIFTLSDFASFSLLQSTMHGDWASYYGSSLGQTGRYNPTDCFETFPFPIGDLQKLAAAGEKYHGSRESVSAFRNSGFTEIYNRFHNPDESAADIQKLRDLHVEMDRAVAEAYGWSDLDLGHGFHETKQGVRFTISESARREVLDRLLKLNHERYAEEVARGLHDKKGKPKATARKGKKASEDDESLLF